MSRSDNSWEMTHRKKELKKKKKKEKREKELFSKSLLGKNKKENPISCELIMCHILCKFMIALIFRN